MWYPNIQMASQNLLCMSFGLLIELLLTFSALFQIEQLLLRNQSPHKVVTEQAYRLQQGLLLTSTQQQV